MEGWILKGVGSFYTVLAGEAQVVAKARGRFRKEGLTPVPGDRVRFSVGEDGAGFLEEIAPRKNLLVRPAVANVDKLMAVLSLSHPWPDLLLCDKLLLQCEIMGITPVLILNKCDEADAGRAEDIAAQYRGTGYRIIQSSAVTGEGLDEIRKEIAGAVCCFAGQSAVGKSSLLNALLPELALEVGALSQKTDRGRHTTRHAELWVACGGAVADTPGFSLLDVMDMEPPELAALYPEMREQHGQCRFPECLHLSEPDCAVKPLLEEGRLHMERYMRYGQLIEELKERKKHRYD